MPAVGRPWPSEDNADDNDVFGLSGLRRLSSITARTDAAVPSRLRSVITLLSQFSSSP